MKPVIQLLRVSTEAQAAEDRASIAAQQNDCAQIAQRYGLTIIDTVTMVDVSGADVIRAPEMVRLLERISNCEVCGVVTREFSRLMRPENFADFAILQVFAEAGAILYLPEGPMDFRTESGRLLGVIHAAMAGNERTAIMKRIASAKEQMRREGRWPNSDRCLPFGIGYDRATSKWFHKPEKAEKVREVFRRYLAGETNFEALARFLGTSKGTARNILENPIYTGWMVYDERRDPSPAAKRYGVDGRQGDRRKVNRDEDDVIRVQVITEPLISQVEFDRVQDMIQRNAARRIRMRTKVGKFVYAGFLWCSKCNARIHTYRNQFDRYYYICSNKKRKNEAGECLCPYTGFMNRDHLESALDKLFGEQLTDEGFLQRLYESLKEQAAKNRSETTIARLQESIERLKGKRKRVLQMFADGDITRDEKTERIAQVDRDIWQAEDMLAAAAPAAELTPGQLVRLFAPLHAWATRPAAEKRRMLASLGAEIRVADYKITGLGVDLAGARVETKISHTRVDTKISHPRMARFPSPAPPCPSPSRRVSCWLQL